MVNIFNEVLIGQVLRFDAVPTENLLGSGSPEFIRACVDQVGLDGQIVDWSMARFCSPFFGIHRSEWRGRITSAWHVTIHFAQVPKVGSFGLKLGSLRVEVHDETAPWDPASQLEWTELPCVVIAHFSLGNWENMDALPASSRAVLAGVERVERLKFKALMELGRFHLGPLTFPEAEGRVNQVSDAIRAAGGAAHCDERVPRSRIAIPPVE